MQRDARTDKHRCLMIRIASFGAKGEASGSLAQDSNSIRFLSPIPDSSGSAREPALPPPGPPSPAIHLGVIDLPGFPWQRDVSTWHEWSWYESTRWC